MNLLICVPQLGAYSETFISNHIKYIAPGKTAVITNKIINLDDFKGIPVLQIKGKGVFSKFNQEEENLVIDFINKNNITHILIEFGNSFSEIIELNIRKLYLPIVVHFHGWDASKALKNETYVNYYKFLSDVANKLIVVSNCMKEQMILSGIDENIIFVNYYGIDISILSKYKKKNNTNKKCRFIFVGRFVPKKSPLKLLESFLLAYKKNANIELIMIGDNTEYYQHLGLFEKAEKFVKMHNLENNVKLLGALPHERVLEEMSKSDVYVQHSITCPETGDSEGLPNSILEASLMGLPVISTKHAGIPEAIQHGINGYLVDEGNIKGMADYILELSKNYSLRRKMGKNSIELNKYKFSLSYSIKKLRKVMLESHLRRYNDNLLTKYYSFNPSLCKINEINKVINFYKKAIVVIYGAGNGLKQYWNIVKESKLNSEYMFLIDDNVKDFLGIKTVSFYEFLKIRKNINNKDSKEMTVYFVSTITKKIFNIIKNKINTLDDKKHIIIPINPNLI